MSQLRMNIPAAFEETLTTAEQIEWLYRFKSAALEAGANIELTPDGDKIIITAKGEGFSPTVSVKEIPGGHEVTITDGTGPHTFDVMDGTDGDDGAPGQDGADGQDGAPGQDGTDGVSPTVSVEPLEEGNGYQVTITDADGPHTFNLYNGPRGYTGPQGPQGVQGVKGDDGVTPEITATATVNNQVGTPSVIVTKSGATTAPNFNFNFQNLKGDKGDKGDTGATGATGAQGEQGIQGVQGERGPQGLQGPQGETGQPGPQGIQGPAGAQGPSGNDGISPEVTITEITGGHTVTITDEEHPLGQSFNVMDGVDGGTGSQGPAGQDGVTPVITATATADALSSANPSVTVTKSGTDAAPSFAFAFSGLKGAQGEQGIQGIQGPAGQDGTDGQDGQNGYTPVITATASVDNVSSNNPTVAVTKTGTDAAPSFAFDFSGLKGATGPQGEQGIQGVQGPAGEDGADGADGVTPVISASATADALSSANPTVTVTKSGTDAAPSFAFAFSGLKGAAGVNGQGVPAGGTAGQVLSKIDGTDYNTGWVTPSSGGGGIENFVIDTSNTNITSNQSASYTEKSTGENQPTNQNCSLSNFSALLASITFQKIGKVKDNGTWKNIYQMKISNAGTTNVGGVTCNADNKKVNRIVATVATGGALYFLNESGNSVAFDVNNDLILPMSVPCWISKNNAGSYSADGMLTVNAVWSRGKCSFQIFICSSDSEIITSSSVNVNVFVFQPGTASSM